MPDGAVIDRFFSSFFSGDLESCRACLTKDAVVWHNYDCIPRDVDYVMQNFANYLAKTTELRVADVRRTPTADGFVQQHLMIIGDAQGRRAFPICIIARIENGLIARLDEYLDRTGGFDPGDAPLTIPGL